MVKINDALNQIRTLRFLPEDISFKSNTIKDIYLELKASLTMSMLIARVGDKNLSIHGFDWNSLKTSTYGSGYTIYDTIAGSAPAAFSDTHELEATSNLFHRFDVAIATRAAEIRFYMDSIQSWGNAIPVPTGTSSIEFSSSKIQIKDDGTPGATYTIIGYR